MVSGDDRARVRRRDDPAPDDARLDDPRARVDAARRARRGRPQRPRVTGDPPEVGDYPGSRGVYEVDSIGLTRLISRAEPRRGLQRPADRRADVVLRRRRRQPDRRRPRARGRALPREARGGRAVRDDADRLRPRRTSTASASSSAAWPIPRARRHLPAHELPARAAPPQRGAGDRRPGARCRTRSRRGRRRAPRSGMAHARELIAEARGRCAGVYVVAPYRSPRACSSCSATSGSAKSPMPPFEDGAMTP